MCNYCKKAREEYRNLNKNSTHGGGTGCPTRWAHESFKIMQRYENVSSRLYGKTSKKIEGEGIKITFTDNTIFRYTFYLNYKYPFYEPTFYINDKPYNEWLTTNKMPMKDYLNVNCFCCESLLINWTAGYKILDLVDEFNLFKTYILNNYRLYWIKKALEKIYPNYEFKYTLKSIVEYLGVYNSKLKFIDFHY